MRYSLRGPQKDGEVSWGSAQKTMGMLMGMEMMSGQLPADARVGVSVEVACLSTVAITQSCAAPPRCAARRRRHFRGHQEPNRGQAGRGTGVARRAFTEDDGDKDEHDDDDDGRRR
ncbi:unnamed protein product [Prorocentrum cordatum]|uniref:Uncharacterized protein n=1 Tax=Prorocentrum cordatum TaxID=2364126 RepID=A0ABN9W790_9DINO|nr:unnamed protein product [Polarella glacialis]